MASLYRLGSPSSSCPFSHIRTTSVLQLNLSPLYTIISTEIVSTSVNPRAINTTVGSKIISGRPPIIQQSRLSLISSLKNLQSALKKLKPIDKNE
jgi:hypothetical protein